MERSEDIPFSFTGRFGRVVALFWTTFQCKCEIKTPGSGGDAWDVVTCDMKLLQ